MTQTFNWKAIINALGQSGDATSIQNINEENNKIQVIFSEWILKKKRIVINVKRGTSELLLLGITTKHQVTFKCCSSKSMDKPQFIEMQ